MNVSVAGAGDEKQIDDKNDHEDESADDDMQRSEAEDPPLARQVRWRYMTFMIMVMTVIGLRHWPASLRRRDRIGIEAAGLCDL
jgi:hypothetical protein